MFVSVRTDSVCVDIRQYWIPPNQTDLVPCKKGICLRPGEYNKLKDTSCVIANFQPLLNTCIPCIYEHQNQMSMLECVECSPNNIAYISKVSNNSTPKQNDSASISYIYFDIQVFILMLIFLDIYVDFSYVFKYCSCVFILLIFQMMYD